VGRLARATDSITGSIEFSYDTLDRLSKELSPQGVVTYTYDALGRRTQMTANGQTPVGYQYDAASRLTQVAQGTQIVGLGYDNANRRTSLTYPNGTNTTYSYDNASRITSITHNGPSGLIESLTYTYDAAGNRISLTRTNGTATLLPAAVQAAYDAANEQIQFNSASPNQTFDANGNLTSDGTNTYTWDARNRLIAISGPGLSASFQYDALGRRISKTINGITTQFLYDGNDNVQEIGGGAVGASYVRSLNIDEPFVRQMTSGNEFYHTDALGSTLALTNTGGATTASYNYEAFGKTTVTGTSSNPFQYTGRENDGAERYYYRARFYNSATQRFIQQDPQEFAGGDINLYAYVGNSPTRFVDPLGLSWVNLGCAEQTANTAYQASLNAGLPGTNQDNSPWNAYLHCKWMCETVKNCSWTSAWVAGTGHELWAERSYGHTVPYVTEPTASWADLRNNSQGRGCGGDPKCGGGKDCDQCCRDQLKSGALTVTPQNIRY